MSSMPSVMARLSAAVPGCPVSTSIFLGNTLVDQHSGQPKGCDEMRKRSKLTVKAGKQDHHIGDDFKIVAASKFAFQGVGSTWRKQAGYRPFLTLLPTIEATAAASNCCTEAMSAPCLVCLSKRWIAAESECHGPG